MDDKQAGSPATRKFALRIALPALAVLFGALGTVVYSLEEMAGEVDQTEEQLTERSVQAGLDAFLRRLSDSHSDYARWDDAVRNLYGDANEAFIKENFATSTESGTFFDAAFLLDEDGKERFGIYGGAPIERAPGELLGPGLTHLVASLPRYDGGYHVKTGLLSTQWGLAGVAVGPVVPSSEEEKPRERERLLILMRSLTSAKLALIGADRVVDGLKFGSDGDENSLALFDPSGAPLGVVSWSPRQIGTRAHTAVNPSVAIMLGLLIVTMAAMIIIAVRSVREVERREADARHSALHDRLTGLPNRQVLLQELQAALGEDDGDRGRVAVLYADLDGFKAVNDHYGHETGDRILREVVERFAARCGTALLARLAGDEFAVVVRGADARERAIEIGSDLNRAVDEPFATDGRAMLRGVSVGICVADQETGTAEELLRRADVAMYQTKQNRPGFVSVYDPTVDREMRERAWLAQQLRLAIREQRLDVVYQPIFCAISGAPIAVEALIRWTPGGVGPVSPAVFVSIAEESGLIDELGGWILRRACLAAMAWPELQIAVNVSPAELRNPRFEAQVADVLRETGLPAERLVVELTETYLIEQPEQAHEAIEGLRRLGIAVALDDFGTGYSSIGYLRRFRFDKLKLDRSLTTGIENDAKAQGLVQATVALADALGLRVTAEGVETEAASIILRTVGCDELQGYYLAAPCSAEAIDQLVHRVRPGVDRLSA